MKNFTIGGTERPALWNVYALAQWEKDIGRDLGSWSADFVSGKVQYMDMIKMVRIALIEGALAMIEKKGEDKSKHAELFSVTDRKVAMWMEEDEDQFGQLTRYCIKNMPFRAEEKKNDQGNS